MFKDDNRQLNQLLALLAENIGADRFDTWFHGQVVITLEPNGRGLLVLVPSPFLRDWLSKQFLKTLKQSAHAVFGFEFNVRFIVDAEADYSEVLRESSPAVRTTNATVSHVTVSHDTSARHSSLTRDPIEATPHGTTRIGLAERQRQAAPFSLPDSRPEASPSEELAEPQNDFSQRMNEPGVTAAENLANMVPVVDVVDVTPVKVRPIGLASQETLLKQSSFWPAEQINMEPIAQVQPQILRLREAKAKVVAEKEANAQKGSRKRGKTGRMSGDTNGSTAGKKKAPMSFDSFVIGSANKFAAMSARMVAERLSQANPLLICGPTGTGKTHLLQSIRHGYRAQNRRAKVVYLTAEQFTTSFVEAIRGRGLASFRQKYRTADLLIIDDIHFFESKRATLEEFLYTIDTLTADGQGLILASDRRPSELTGMGAEIISRLSAGLVAEMQLPDFETRVGILRNFAFEKKIVLQEDVLQAIATHVTVGPRQLSGALNRLHVMSMAYETPITRAFVERELHQLDQQQNRPVRLTDIQKAVCEVFGMDASVLKSNKKSRAVSGPRMLAMWLARKYTHAALSEIGTFFGRRSHSTVLSAQKRIETLMSQQQSIEIANQACSMDEAIRRLEYALRTA